MARRHIPRRGPALIGRPRAFGRVEPLSRAATRVAQVTRRSRVSPLHRGDRHERDGRCVSPCDLALGIVAVGTRYACVARRSSRIERRESQSEVCFRAPCRTAKEHEIAVSCVVAVRDDCWRRSQI